MVSVPYWCDQVPVVISGQSSQRRLSVEETGVVSDLPHASGIFRLFSRPGTGPERWRLPGRFEREDSVGPGSLLQAGPQHHREAREERFS